MMKSLLVAFLTAIMIGGLTLVSILHFGTVQASTNVTGIINSDTTWTKANSPYTLTGLVGVSNGVTLTIEAGVAVNGAGIEVNGTLVARGSIADPIYFNSVQITFTESSNSWNEQTGSGSIIENAHLESGIEIYNVSPKINSNSITGYISVHNKGAPVISNNIVTGGDYANAIISAGDGATVVLNNTVIANDSHDNGIDAGDSSAVSRNTVTSSGGSFGSFGISTSGAYISDNIISGFQMGIVATYGSTIERNLITNNEWGINTKGGGHVIRYNTIANNVQGIFHYVYASTIIYNNIQDNSYNLYLETYAKNDINATYNWWGTTDTQAISQKIYDFEDNYKLGKVTFIPFLTAPNPEAPPMPTPTPTLTPTPTSTPTQSPSTSPSPSQSPTATPTTPQTELNQIEVAILIVLIVIVALLIVVIGLLLRKRR